MRKCLSVVMVVWCLVCILFGLGFVCAPGQLADVFRFLDPPAYAPYYMALIGIGFLLGGIFVLLVLYRWRRLPAIRPSPAAR
jgi:hypothetical protein